jgi:GNAT superfamily N-acetyltransferase
MQVTEARTDAEILECWPVMAQLRPAVQRPDFVGLVRRQFAEGYRLACLRAEGRVTALAGFRILHSLYWGRFCYVDDLVTDNAARSRGHGAALMDWLQNLARTERCTRLELDSGVQRWEAHRFYLRERMAITCFHFSLTLDGAEPGPRAAR